MSYVDTARHHGGRELTWSLPESSARDLADSYDAARDEYERRAATGIARRFAPLHTLKVFAWRMWQKARVRYLVWSYRRSR